MRVPSTFRSGLLLAPSGARNQGLTFPHSRSDWTFTRRSHSASRNFGAFTSPLRQESRRPGTGPAWNRTATPSPGSWATSRSISGLLPSKKSSRGHCGAGALSMSIEPDVVYRLVKARDPEELANVVRYDDLDILSQTNEVEYSLTNTILARKNVPDGTADTPQAQELISWRISQKYYFDPTFGGVLGPNNPIVWEPTLSLTGFHFIPGRRLSPVVSDLKLAPFSFYDTELKVDLSPNGGGILDAGITSHVRHGVYGLAFTDFFINKNTYSNLLSGSTSSPSTTTSTSSYHLLNLLATYGDINRKGLSGAFGVNYNLVQKIAAGVVGQLSYNFGCFGLNVEYQRFSLGTIRQENVFRMAISLANIGTFGDFKPRDRLY